MSRRKPEPRTTERADALETTDGILTFARIDGHTLHRDRAGRVILTPPGDNRAGSILEPDAVARLHHALGCALWPYGTKPDSEMVAEINGMIDSLDEHVSHEDIAAALTRLRDAAGGA